MPLIREKTHEGAPHMHACECIRRVQHTCDCRGGERKHCHLRRLHSCCLVKSQLFHRISGHECSTTWLSAAAIGSASSFYGPCCVLASSLSRWLVSNPFGRSNNNRHIDLTSSRYRTREWNKRILSLELTEHTWISRDAGGDQISDTLPRIVGEI